MAYQSLMDLMNNDAMQQGQMRAQAQQGQLQQLQLGQAQEDMQRKAQLRDLLPQIMGGGGNPQAMLEKLMATGNPDAIAMAGQLVPVVNAMQKENDNIVVGRSLMNKKSGNIVGTDSTWADEQKAGRDAKMQELQVRMQDSATSRADRLSLQREMMSMRMDIQREAMATRRDTIAQGNKPPSGYRYTANGNLEQIPGGPADQKTQIRLEGGGTVDTVITGLRDMYNKLDESGGITNPEKSGLSNFPAGIASSGLGQATGRMFGTQNQSSRNTIAQTRPILLQAIMKATGMSAKQMDSNAELKLYLATATDPTLDVSANKRALDMIESLYGSGAKPITPKAPVNPAKPAANGIKFLGFE